MTHTWNPNPEVQDVPASSQAVHPPTTCWTCAWRVSLAPRWVPRRAGGLCHLQRPILVGPRLHSLVSPFAPAPQDICKCLPLSPWCSHETLGTQETNHCDSTSLTPAITLPCVLCISLLKTLPRYKFRNQATHHLVFTHSMVFWCVTLLIF